MPLGSFRRPHSGPCRVRRALAALLGSLLALCPPCGFAWGDRGHEIIGLIADRYLEAPVKRRVLALLAGDSSALTPTTGLADEATWADKFRDSDRNGSAIRYRQTQAWHYVDLELDAPDLDRACHGHPPVPLGTPASAGPAEDCIVDKIEQFRHELRDRSTATDERRLALQFLLHLVGDIHQPLHATDRHDKGGNALRVQDLGSPPGSLHHYWDTVVVERLGGDSAIVAARLAARLSRKHRRAIRGGSAADWARESFQTGRLHTYGLLPPQGETPGSRTLFLSEAYSRDAEAVAALQMQRAGIRLAQLLNESLR